MSFCIENDVQDSWIFFCWHPWYWGRNMSDEIRERSWKLQPLPHYCLFLSFHLTISPMPIYLWLLLFMKTYKWSKLQNFNLNQLTFNKVYDFKRPFKNPKVIWIFNCMQTSFISLQGLCKSWNFHLHQPSPKHQEHPHVC